MKLTISRLLKLVAVSAVGIAFSIHVNSKRDTTTPLGNSSPFVDRFLDVIMSGTYYSIAFMFVVSIYVKLASLIARFRSPESAYVVSFGRVVSYLTSSLLVLFFAGNTIVNLVQVPWNLLYAQPILDADVYREMLDGQIFMWPSIASAMLATCMILPMLGHKMKDLLRHELLDGLVAAHWILFAVVSLLLRCRTILW